jgi:hypothetical protein
LFDWNEIAKILEKKLWMKFSFDIFFDEKSRRKALSSHNKKLPTHQAA